MRTQEQRKAIADECVRIEKEGGDVLAYLKGKGFLYTTESVWRNLQTEILHRAPGSVTDGKPKEAKDMNDRKEIAYALRDGYYENGEEIRSFLEDCGYSDPSNGLSSVKDWAKKNDPECYEAIRNLTIRGPQKRKPSETAQNGPQTSPEVSPKDVARRGRRRPDAQHSKKQKHPRADMFLRKRWQRNLPGSSERRPDPW